MEKANETFSELKELGLNTKEISVYIALIKLGKTTTSKIIKMTGIPSSKIYIILEGLASKGLASYTVSANKKYFEAADPKVISNLYEEKIDDLKNKKKEITRTIEEISQLKDVGKKPYEITIYEGIKGIKTWQEILLNKLKKGDSVHLVGDPPLKNEILQGYFENFHRRRVKKGINYQIIKNYLGKDIKFIEQFGLTEVKYSPKELDMPILYQTARDYVSIVIYDPFPLMFVIENKKIAEAFKNYFDLMWKIAKR